MDWQRRVLAFLFAILAFTHAASIHFDINHADILIEDNQDNSPPPTHDNDHLKFGHIKDDDLSPKPPHQDYLADLDSYRHRGYLSENGSYIKFNNIPYAEPPVKVLRFARPEYYYSPDYDIKDGGSEERACPQSLPGWFPYSAQFLQCYKDLECDLNGNWTNKITTDDYERFPPSDGGILPKNLRQDEDCLLLDVYVPEAIWNNRTAQSAPVLVWIHGGGFVFGWKSQSGSPAGLFRTANESNQEPFIFVAINYRLGAFGWLGGDNFFAQGGHPNVGLHDQSMAFQWVQDHIGEFGGNRDRVTVMGESAGASSILHHLTSWGGEESLRPQFAQAIMESPAFFPQPDPDPVDKAYVEFQIQAEAFSLYHLKNADTNKLQFVNAKMNYYADYGTFRFGPTTYQPDHPVLPGLALKNNEYYHNISLITGHSFLDGLLFAPPWIRNETSLEKHILELYPKFDPEALKTLKKMYPIVPSLGARAAIATVFDLLDDVAISCNDVYLSEAAVKNGTDKYYRYLLSAPPAPIHGLFPSYVFYPTDGNASLPGLPQPDPTLAKNIQRGFIDFVVSGRPSAPGPEQWPVYNRTLADDESVGKVARFGRFSPESQDVFVVEDPMLRAAIRNRCPKLWQDAPFSTRDRNTLVTQRPGYQWDL